jgi:hypothetical protein
MEEIEVGHMCPHCGKGVVLTLQVGITHASGTVRKADKKKSVKVEAVSAELS